MNNKIKPGDLVFSHNKCWFRPNNGDWKMYSVPKHTILTFIALAGPSGQYKVIHGNKIGVIATPHELRRLNDWKNSSIFQI